MVSGPRSLPGASVLQTFFERYLPSLELEMQDVFRASDPGHEGFFGMLRYHMGWADASFDPCQMETGKRVRPVLCLLSCEACGGAWEQALPAGAAIELLHNFTLIHDDIEDRDATRRGRPTVWALWGDAQGINAGDALFSLAHLALLRLSDRGVPADRVVEALHLLNRAELALTAGQYLDIGFESRAGVSVAEYLAMIEGKTARLAACACEMGALVAGAPGGRRACLRAFGLHLGLAFQVRDDILGIWGDPPITGKPAGADIVRRKKSLPILHGLERSAALRALLARDALSADDVRSASGLLEEAGSRDYAERVAQEHHDLAMAELARADLHGEAGQALHELAEALLGRVK